VGSEVNVYVAAGERNLLAGRLRQAGGETGAASFVYDGRYLADPEAYPLDPALPLVPGALQAPPGRETFGVFADSGPDAWGRSLARRAKLPDVLTGVRDDLRQGALRYACHEAGPFLAPESPPVPALAEPDGLAELGRLLDVAARAERGAAGHEELLLLVRAGGSIGGWRPKVHAADAAGRPAIAKLPKAGWDAWDVMTWEKVAHDLARAAGISLPDSGLVGVGGAHVFVVTRFDRRGGSRIGYASARTMLNAGPEDRRSYLEIADVIAQRSPAAAADLRELWRRVAFSVLISNTDDHLRNHGFLHAGGGSWALSPAFDLNPNPAPGPKHLSTAIDRTDTTASVAALMRVAGHFGLDATAALDVLADVTQAVASWRDVAASYGLAGEDAHAMEPAFEHAETELARSLTAGRVDRLA
jgi:serine/threonine-protein kinase HipA